MLFVLFSSKIYKFWLQNHWSHRNLRYIWIFCKGERKRRITEFDQIITSNDRWIWHGKLANVVPDILVFHDTRSWKIWQI